MSGTKLSRMNQQNMTMLFFFFSASCLIILKRCSNEDLLNFTKWSNDNGINWEFIVWAEKLILTKSKSFLYLDTSRCIVNGFSDYCSKINDHMMIDTEMITAWINFAINEYEIYGRYSNFIIIVSSILNTINKQNNEGKEQINGDLCKIFVEFLKENKVKDEKIEEIYDCAKEMKMAFEANEDEDDTHKGK